MEEICSSKLIDMSMENLHLRKENTPDTIAALVLMQKSLLSELRRKQNVLFLTGSEVQHLRVQNKMLEQQIASMINMVRNFDCPMN